MAKALALFLLALIGGCTLYVIYATAILPWLPTKGPQPDQGQS